MEVLQRKRPMMHVTALVRLHKKRQRERPQRRLFMKKNRFLLVGLISLLLVSGAFFTGCSRGCSYGNCTVNSDGSGSTCNDGGCAAAAALGRNHTGVPPGCNC